MMKVIASVSCAGYGKFLVLISFTWAVNITGYGVEVTYLLVN